MRQGFILIPRTVLESTKLSAGAKLVYVWLRSLQNQDEIAWPALDHIATTLNFSRSSVRTYIKQLERAKLIDKKLHPGMRCTFKVLV